MGHGFVNGAAKGRSGRSIVFVAMITLQAPVASSIVTEAFVVELIPKRFLPYSRQDTVLQ